MKHTIIVGGGAAGMTAAIAAAQKGEAVTVLERGRKILKKLGVTGNGRGNLLNCGAPRYYGDTTFANCVLAQMPYERVAAFLEDCGIPLVHEEEGRIYPSSFLASSAVEALRYRAQQLGVAVETNVRVTDVQHRPDGTFALRGSKAHYAEDVARKSGKTKPGALLGEETVRFSADRVIVAAGGAAAPMHGTDGTAYGLLTGFGHGLIAPRPALCALLADVPRELAGQRARAKLRLCNAQGKLLAQSEGEALFATDGISGIAAMQLARFASPSCVLHMDLRRAVTGREEGDTFAWLVARAARTQNADGLLVGAAPSALAQALWHAAGCAPSLEPKVLQRLAAVVDDFAFPVAGTRGFENAQVTAGGVDCAGFEPSTLESRLCPGLYAVGEVLNVDGDCGGYNLMFAFATGLLAGCA